MQSKSARIIPILPPPAELQQSMSTVGNSNTMTSNSSFEESIATNPTLGNALKLREMGRKILLAHTTAAVSAAGGISGMSGVSGISGGKSTVNTSSDYESMMGGDSKHGTLTVQPATADDGDGGDTIGGGGGVIGGGGAISGDGSIHKEEHGGGGGGGGGGVGGGDGGGGTNNESGKIEAEITQIEMQEQNEMKQENKESLETTDGGLREEVATVATAEARTEVTKIGQMTTITGVKIEGLLIPTINTDEMSSPDIKKQKSIDSSRNNTIRGKPIETYIEEMFDFEDTDEQMLKIEIEMFDVMFNVIHTLKYLLQQSLRYVNACKYLSFFLHAYLTKKRDEWCFFVCVCVCVFCGFMSPYKQK